MHPLYSPLLLNKRMENVTIGVNVVMIISWLCIATPTAHARKQLSGGGGNAWLQTRTSYRGTESENITKIHFYVHDVRAGANATTYEVATSSITSTSSTSFGQIKVYDDRATAEADINSEEVARAQGMATSADLQNRAVAMSLNFLLTSGEFNGSTISVVGRNQVGNPSREMTVVGGTGPFRSARGHVVTSTYFDSADYSILEYTIYATYSLTQDDVGLWADF